MEAFIAEEMKNYKEKLQGQQEKRRHYGSCGGDFQIVNGVQNRVMDMTLNVTALETILLTLPKFLKEIVE
jgi:hypothetical protein